MKRGETGPSGTTVDGGDVVLVVGDPGCRRREGGVESGLRRRWSPVSAMGPSEEDEEGGHQREHEDDLHRAQ